MDMLLKALQKNRKNESGFTLVEIMITVLIIGVLAAIAVPIFLNQQSAGRDTEMKSALLKGKTIVETERGGNNGYYPTYTPSAVVKGLPDGVAVRYTYSTDQTQYCLTATTTDSSKAFYLSSSSSTPSDAVCGFPNVGTVQP